MCNVFSIKPFQDISGGPAVHKMTQSFLVQQMQGVNSVSELVFQCTLCL